MHLKNFWNRSRSPESEEGMENSISKQERLGCNIGRGVDNWSCYTDCAFWDRRKCTRYEIGRKEVIEAGALTKEQYRALWMNLVEKCNAQQQEIDRLKEENKLFRSDFAKLHEFMSTREYTGGLLVDVVIKQVTALTADKDEQAGRLMRYDTALRQAREALNDLLYTLYYLINESEIVLKGMHERHITQAGEVVTAIDKAIGGKEDV
jgi:hypothetical protein